MGSWFQQFDCSKSIHFLVYSSNWLKSGKPGFWIAEIWKKSLFHKCVISLNRNNLKKKLFLLLKSANLYHDIRDGAWLLILFLKICNFTKIIYDNEIIFVVICVLFIVIRYSDFKNFCTFVVFLKVQKILSWYNFNKIQISREFSTVFSIL